MINFVYFAIILVFILLIIGFSFANYTITILSSLGMMTLGVYGLINGIETVNNILSMALSIVLVTVGAYIFITGNIEQIGD